MSDYSWSRLECDSRSAELEPGLQAPIGDPLWLLARQWQVGEFDGEDAAMPVKATVTTRSAYLGTASADPEPTGGAGVVPLPSSQPLETLVERQPVVLDGPSASRLAGEAGLQWLRMLSAEGLGRLRGAFRSLYPLALPPDVDRLPPRSRHLLRMLHRRSFDARGLAADLLEAPARDRLGGRLTDLDLSAEETSALVAAADRWLAWYRGRVSEPAAGDNPTWRERRLEHGFSLAAPCATGDLVLSAREYADGRLDWSAFDLLPEATHGNPRSPITPVIRHRVPTRVRYRGMPALRWWQLEDNRVYFGDLEAEQNDLSKLLLAQFGVVYGDDWYMLPLRLPTSTLTRSDLRVRDGMGGTHVIPSAAQVDGAERVWRFFELTGNDSAEGASPSSPLLLVPPVLASTLQGPDLERVGFLRDEQANLAWGVEERIEDAAGYPLDRKTDWQRLGVEEAVQPAVGDTWAYTLAPTVPPHWVPLVPVQVEPGPAILFQRARMATWVAAGGEVRSDGARGEILLPDAGRPLYLHEEEIPRGGLLVSRAWQLTRSWDGSVHLWVGRRKMLGRGERASGMVFDALSAEAETEP